MKPEIKVVPPGARARKIIERDARVASPSDIKAYPLVVERGEGCWIWDVDGNRYLDFMAGIAVTSTGHAHPDVVQAIQQSASRFLHICGTDFYYEARVQLGEKLAGYLPEMGPKRVFLTNSGTEAVEAAIKLARFHTRRPSIIAFKGAFHGRTLGSLSLTSSKAVQRAFFGPLLPGVVHVPYSYPYRCPYGAPATQCRRDCQCARRIESDWFHTHLDPGEVAALFVEPILGEGGYVIPAPGFLQDLRRLCDDHGILLVFDEIQCGVGRTGRMFAAETMGVTPDILLCAKGLASGMPIGAMVARREVMNWPRGSHGSTFGGNPVACHAALATLEIVEKLLPSVRQTGHYLLQRLQEMEERHAVIGEARGIGLMTGLELVEPDTAQPSTRLAERLQRMAFERGLLLLTCGESTLRLAPPLVIETPEVDTALQILESCLESLGEAGR